MSEEEEIIQNGLKSHTKTDTLCYIGIGLLAILIFIPPIFRVIFKDLRPKDTHETAVYMNLVCRKSYFDNNGKVVSNEFTGKYRDSVVQKLVIIYTYTDDAEPNLTDPEITPLLDLANASNGKIEKQIDKNIVTFTIDYVKNKDLNTNQDFKDYSKAAPGQLTELRNSGYICSTESEEVEEDVSKIDANFGN